MNFDCRIKPHLGALRLDKVTPSHWMDLDSKLKGRGLSQSSRHQVRVTASKMLDWATRREYVNRNTAKMADRIGQGSPTIKTWDGEQLRAFITGVEDDRLYPAFVFAASTGCRRGETLGLRWQDLDLENATAKICQTLICINYKLSFSEPKTKRGYRTLTLEPAVIAVLKAHRRRQVEERLAWGPAYQDSGLVFTREDGSPIHPQAISDAFNRHVSRLGLPRLTLHGLRHSWATVALGVGVPLWAVADSLGHGSIAITDRFYRGSIPSAMQEASAKVAGAIFGGSQT